MYRVSTRLLHTPSIRFTYALAKSGAAGAKAPAAAAAGAAAAAAPPPVQSILDSFADLPKHLRPHVFEDNEIETILLGGAAPYVPKHLQKKKK